MNEHDTTVLRSRLHALADDLTPQVDVVGQVRGAREKHRRARRGRIALLGVATATAAVVVGSVVVVDVLSSDRTSEVATPTAPPSAGPEPTVAPTVAPDERTSETSAPLPDGQHFAYVTAARAADPGSPSGGVGQLTIRPAEWLGSGIDDLSCLAGQEAPLNVSDHCVGPAGASQVLGATDGPFELHPGGNPFRTVGFAEFSAVVTSEAAVPQGPVMGWLTIRDGVVVGFEQVTEQIA